MAEIEQPSATSARSTSTSSTTPSRWTEVHPGALRRVGEEKARVTFEGAHARSLGRGAGDPAEEVG